MNVLKIRKFCSPFRIALGVILIGVAVYTGNPWFYLGIIPLLAGFSGFCPLCGITGQCSLFNFNKSDEKADEMTKTSEDQKA